MNALFQQLSNFFKVKTFHLKGGKKKNTKKPQCSYIIKCVYKLSQLNGPDKERRKLSWWHKAWKEGGPGSNWFGKDGEAV